MMRFSMVFVACMAMGMLFGCGKDSVGDYCNKVESCAKKAGQAFSISECTHSINRELEELDILGCGGEYEDLLDCLSGVSCTELVTSVTNEQIPVECGAKANALDRCIN
ncbi:MAG TPA: hypothetical protein PLN07_10235 [Myxococcota bacterium]|nr:hypothetical protein [Myxococcota bacterium]